MICFIRNRDNYTLHKRLHYFSAFTRKALAALIAVFCISSLCHGQDVGTASDSGEEEISPLSVGEKVPAEFWTREHLFYIDGDTVRKNLEEYKGKLLVLDFWATWCGPCIQNIPIVDSLLKNDAPGAKVLYATTDGYETVRSFRNRDLITKNVDMHILLEDDRLRYYFPHPFMPHYALIAEDRTVRAQVNELEMNGALLSFLKQNPQETFENQYTAKEGLQPIFLADRFGKNKGYSYSFFKEGFDEDYGGANIKRRNQDGVYSITLANTSLRTCIDEIGKLYAEAFHIQFSPKFVEKQKDIAERTFTYEFSIPEGEEKFFLSHMINDLSKYLPIKITPYARKQKILAISSPLSFNEGARTALARQIENNLEGKWMVLDFTDSYQNSGVTVEGKDVESIRKSIAGEGYTLEEKNILLPYISIENKNDEFNL